MLIIRKKIRLESKFSLNVLQIIMPQFNLLEHLFMHNV